MVLTHHHHHQQQQHISHLDRVGIYLFIIKSYTKYIACLSKIQSKVPESPGMGKPKGNPYRIKYQSYTGVWVSYTAKNPKSRCFGGWGLEL